MSYRHRRMKCKCLLYFSFFCFTGNATRIIAQVKEIPDTKLPFFLHANKKLDPSELAEKKEGWYFTGLPLFTSDPVRGQGAGIRGSLYFNGKKSDPLYEYQPYVYRISTQVYKSSEGVQNHFVSFDTPFIFNSPYRFKVSLGLDDNHHSQYFGIGEQSMKPLSYRDRGQPGGQLYRNANFSEKENSQKYRRPGQTVSEGPYASDQFYNQYWFESTTLATSIDKTFWGAFKWVFANEISKNVIRTYDGKISDAYDPVFGETKIKEINSILPTPNGTTKVTEDQNSGKIKGYHGGQINYFRVGFAYDTRDFEPDPDSGMLAEINFTNVSKATGSGFDYNKIFGQVKLFYMPFPKLFEELVIATRGGVSYTSNGAPFSEIRYIWSIDGSFTGIGGLSTLRGYRQDRFIGPVLGFGNLETRWRFATLKYGSELFTFSLVPFYDLGRVWDNPNRINTQGYAHSYGVGLRIIWNQATVILIDYAKSREDTQTFVDFNHIF